MKKLLLSAIITVVTAISIHAQCNYIASTSTSVDTLTYTFSGGSFQSYGCAPIDPTYWLAGNGMSVTITFTNPENYPTFRVWGMNNDDVASVSVNGANYPLTSSSASYDTKVVCGLSPGPDGVIFSGGNLTGANTNFQGNYSYQNVQLATTNVNTITITGIAGAGWGFAGASVGCPLTGINNINTDLNTISINPNPTKDRIKFSSNVNMQLSNIAGQVIADIKNINTFDLSNQPSGIYILTINDKQGNSLQRNKIVKE
ncbi:MAG TPA: T9SS type A sorting domain-containing protein [Bacteroidia bacterium]|nr:T9SS type A sorting domain-containing protein [Bacteroidia bacterium]